jgi:cell division protein FtsB
MLKNAIALFIFTTVVLLAFLPSYTQLQDLKERNREYADEIRSLQAKHIELKEEFRRLKEDPVYLEKVAREKMGLVREGEVVYQLVPVMVNKEQ